MGLFRVESMLADDRARVTLAQRMRGKHYLKIAHQLTTDPKKEARLQACKCQYCFYLPAVGGQGFSEYTCLRCEQRFQATTTTTPAFCEPCAAPLGVCAQCGGDINLELEKKEPTDGKG